MRCFLLAVQLPGARHNGRRPRDDARKHQGQTRQDSQRLEDVGDHANDRFLHRSRRARMGGGAVLFPGTARSNALEHPRGNALEHPLVLQQPSSACFLCNVVDLHRLGCTGLLTGTGLVLTKVLCVF